MCCSASTTTRSTSCKHTSSSIEPSDPKAPLATWEKAFVSNVTIWCFSNEYGGRAGTSR